MDVNTMKRTAGIESCDWVLGGMSVGLGTGSTVAHTVIELGRRVRERGTGYRRRAHKHSNNGTRN